MSVEERVSPGHSQPVWDFSGLHGFQFVGASDGAAVAEAPDDEQRRAALTLELDARAARFHQAVDSSIVLSSDGAIRWLGDSVARLAAGDDFLSPRAILLADAAMSEDAQKVALTRLELWLGATIQRLLGPLFALRSLQEGAQPLQDLAAKIAGALGVLEREPVRGVVRNLDQTARAVLRKHGVRFGSYYLYVPSTLRPAARALALQLFCIQKGDEDFAAAAQGLIPMASSGRTSAPPDARVGAETYRVGGFRRCGERVVRVDIVERLADMIRAGSVLRLVGSEAGAPAFQVTSQMTSLTGCSGDSFFSILRALSFESFTVRRSEIVWPAASAPVAAPAEAAAAEVAATDVPVDQAGHAAVESEVADQSAEAAERGTGESAPPPEEPETAAVEDTAPADEHEVATYGAGLEARADEPPETHLEEAAPAVESDVADVEPELSETAAVMEEPAAIEAAEAPPAAPDIADAEAELSEAAAAMEEPAAIQSPEAPPAETDAALSETTADIAAVAAPEAEATTQPAEDEMVIIWRFVRPAAPPRHRHARPFRHKVPAQPERGPQSPGAP